MGNSDPRDTPTLVDFDIKVDLAFNSPGQNNEATIFPFNPTEFSSPTDFLLQESQNLGFGFLWVTPDPFDPNLAGLYTFTLSVSSLEGVELASVTINVQVGPSVLDHFQCYTLAKKSTELDFKPVVDLEDLFAVKLGVKVDKQPAFFCPPVMKGGGGISNPEIHLTCYKIKGAKPKEEVFITNQGGEHTLMVKEHNLLCEPTEKLGFQVIEEDEGAKV